MNFFRNLKDKWFAPKEEEWEEEIEENDDVSELIEMEEETSVPPQQVTALPSTEKERAFRFPITSLGREDERDVRDVEEQIEQTERVEAQPTEMASRTLSSFEEEYQPVQYVPLYQNKRWPTNRGKEQRQQTIEPKVKQDRAAMRKTMKEERHHQASVLQQQVENQQSKRPFQSTEVPSPIFGHQERNVDRPIRLLREMNEPLHRKEDRPVQSRSTSSHEEKKTTTKRRKHVSPAIEQMDQYTALITERREDLQPIVQTYSGKRLDVPTYQRDKITSSTEREDCTQVEREEHSTPPTVDERERNIVPPLVVASEEEIERSRPVSFEEDEATHIDEGEDSNEATSVVQVAQDEREDVETAQPRHALGTAADPLVVQVEGPVTVQMEEHSTQRERPKENIRPFNVLMLPSDYAKLNERKLREAQAHERVEKSETSPTFETVDVEQSSQDESVSVKQHERQGEEEEERIAEETFDEPLPFVEKSQQSEQSKQRVEDDSPIPMKRDVVPPSPYTIPPISYLAEPAPNARDEQWLEEQSKALEETLAHFSIQAEVERAIQGPSVTRFELTLERGTKVSKIRNLTDDLKLALAAKDIRIEAPIPGTSFIGIEVPNKVSRPVHLKEVLQSDAFQQSNSPLEAVLGLNITGGPETIDLRKMPHGLIAGATGSGKSVCINCILTSLLYKSTPEELNLLLIDPKMVELAPYNDIAHLISPVITDVKAATLALKWAVNEMENRYQLFATLRVRNIEKYNELVEKDGTHEKMPYLLIVIDELADLMMMAPQDVELSISRIAQKARAAGIHLLIATQRPSVDVITGTIKANVPTRIAFSVSSQIDSRTILDQSGAERLLGKGDMLYLGSGESVPVRLQGAFVSDEEIETVIDHVQREREPNYKFGEDDLLKIEIADEQDPLFKEVCEFIVEQQSASTSALQRQFSIGYNRAARIMEQLEEEQFISEQNGTKPRTVFLQREQLDQL